jgi:hypothetical protein
VPSELDLFLGHGLLRLESEAEMREEFAPQTKDVLAKRVGYRCSNPGCQQVTSGPADDPARAVNVGVAAHITAASPGGPRYNAALSAEERSSIGNGIWLCQTCGKLVDNDDARFTVASLSDWKRIVEAITRGEIEQRIDLTANRTQKYRKAEQLMPALLMEMRKDLAEYPVRREFVLLKRAWSYWAKGNEFGYFFDDHDELLSKVQVLENLGLVREMTYNNVKRFLFTEELADYLTATNPGY